MGSNPDSWLCDAAGRERLLEMGGRMRSLRTSVFVLQVIALAACAPWIGWWSLLPLVPAAVGFALVDRYAPGHERPEIAYFAAWVLAQGMIALGAALSGAADSPVLCWFAIPVGTLAGRFTLRGVVAGAGVSLIFLLAATLAVEPGHVAENPALVVFPAMAVLCVAVLGVALMRSDVEHRSSSVVDPLTQMLNRRALGLRATELAEQSAVTGEPVGVVLGDVDRFKAVNDEHGHQTGDQVLQEIAYRLRKALRAYDLAYRLGGEEFLVLVPGARLDETAEVAERLRAAISDSPIAGIRVTMSFGVAASDGGTAFDLRALSEQADAHLYEAKSGGRDRIAGSPPPAITAAA